MGHLVLALGLLGRDADAQGLSVDALIEGVESGQLDPYILSDTFTRLSDCNWVKLIRPNSSLKQAAQISKLHSYVISQMLDHWLPNIDCKKRGLGDLLDTLLFSLSFAQIGLSDTMRKYLQGFSGSSKAAKAAKQLLKLESPKDNVLEIIRAEAIEHRLKIIGPV